MGELVELLAVLGLRLLADVADAAFLPLGKDFVEQFLTVAEVPVEAALGDAATLGEHLDAQARQSFFGEHIVCGLDPGFPVQCLTGCSGAILGIGGLHCSMCLTLRFPYDSVWKNIREGMGDCQVGGGRCQTSASGAR